VVRAIEDGATGNRWLLVKDPSDRGGPGKMILVANLGEVARDDDSKCGAGNEPAEKCRRSVAKPEMIVAIHAGEALVVEEHSPVVDARLQATALESAVVGSRFEARLKIGGKVVRAVALAPGKAEIKPEVKTQP
jgi:hypothetical protein